MTTGNNEIYSFCIFFLDFKFYCEIVSKYSRIVQIIFILETLSLVLGQALVLLDHDFTFSRNHVICIMRALQKVRLFLLPMFRAG
jgi:hypothetical protein